MMRRFIAAGLLTSAPLLAQEPPASAIDLYAARAKLALEAARWDLTEAYLKEAEAQSARRKDGHARATLEGLRKQLEQDRRPKQEARR